MSEQSTALPCTQTRFALCFVLPGAMPSHCTFPDCFNHRALGIRPRSPLWLARVTGYPMPNHRRTALDSPKAKTPQSTLWSWLLARATARRLNWSKDSLAVRQDHTGLCGVLPVPFAQLPHRTRQSYISFLPLAMLIVLVGHFFSQLKRPVGWHPFAPLCHSRTAHAQQTGQLCSRSRYGNAVLFGHSLHLLSLAGFTTEPLNPTALWGH